MKYVIGTKTASNNLDCKLPGVSFCDRAHPMKEVSAIFTIKKVGYDKNQKRFNVLVPVKEYADADLLRFNDINIHSLVTWQRIKAAVARGELVSLYPSLTDIDNICLWLIQVGPVKLASILYTPVLDRSLPFRVVKEHSCLYAGNKIEVEYKNGERLSLSAADVYKQRERCTNAWVRTMGETVETLRVVVEFK